MQGSVTVFILIARKRELHLEDRPDALVISGFGMDKQVFCYRLEKRVDCLSPVGYIAASLECHYWL